MAQAVGEGGQIHGIDISEGMYLIATARVEGAGLSKRVDLRCGDAAKLPYEANSFDALFMSFTLELFDTPEIPIVLQECRRVLRSGGRIAVVAMWKKSEPGQVVRLYEWAHEKIPNYVDCRPIHAKQALAEAGFQAAQRIDMRMWGLPVAAVVAKKA